jgi:ABC-2 type transport system ATP-binding protein
MIQIQNFSKLYGDFRAVNNLSLTIEKGDAFGFIGPNGAGKTTTMKFLATLLKPTYGDASINGHWVSRAPDDVKRSIGYMPDSFGVYQGMRVWEYLDFFAAAYGIRSAARRQVIDDSLRLLDLEKIRDEYVNNLSRGVKQRLCLAKTLLHNPPVLVLDEPASGLDPRARIYIKGILAELRKMGKTILISSHILSELADCCNKVGIIEKGRLLAAGPVEQILKMIRSTRRMKLEVLDGESIARGLLEKNGGIKSVQVEGKEMDFEFDGGDEGLAALLSELVGQGVRVVSFREIEVSLEEAFLRITRGEIQ